MFTSISDLQLTDIIIPAMKLGAGNTETEIQMAYAFHKLFLFVLQHWHESGYTSVTSVEQVAPELMSSSSAIRATDCLIPLLSIFQ
jgi:hypothetical protein